MYAGAVDNDCTLLDVDDDTSEWTAFDYCSGHSEMTGQYHCACARTIFMMAAPPSPTTARMGAVTPALSRARVSPHITADHFPPSCLLDQATTATGAGAGDHSPQIGWAYDGFPIYGHRGPRGAVMAHEEQGCTGDNCLDSCSGQERELPEVDAFKYVVVRDRSSETGVLLRSCYDHTNRSLGVGSTSPHSAIERLARGRRSPRNSYLGLGSQPRAARQTANCQVPLLRDGCHVRPRVAPGLPQAVEHRLSVPDEGATRGAVRMSPFSFHSESTTHPPPFHAPTSPPTTTIPS